MRGLNRWGGCVCVGILGLLSTPAQASVQCWVNGAVNLNFGDIQYRSATDVWSALPYACQVPWDGTGARYHIRLCHFIEQDAAVPGVAPRWLRHWDGTQMQYDLYHDAARTQLTGPAGSSWPAESWFLEGTSNAQVNGTLMLYGRVPPGQGALSNGVYESHYAGGRLRWRWSKGDAPLPTEMDCRQGSGGEGGGEVSYFLNVLGNSREACYIQAVTPLDFGVVTDRRMTSVEQAGRIEVRCPLSVSWRLGLDNGLYAQGAQRRMVNARGEGLAYVLYRDAARTQPWGEGESEGMVGMGRGVGAVSSIPVYGRASLQGVTSAGEYTDTVTVTLTY
ncbi:spore coat protein U domain-containing protein (plasmid) [Serratia nevei]|uniref:Csu type fimbrial protein n=1 Tax=Serratia nevei TaxID=2703794 RepID=UPI003F6D4708